VQCQDIENKSRPKKHQPFLTFRSNTTGLAGSADTFGARIFVAAQKAPAEPIPWCACFAGGAVEISMYTVQPFQILFFGVYISDEPFSLSLEIGKPIVSF
jgi:hypothetical protein